MSLLKRSALARDIILVLTVKLCALAGLWFFFVQDHKVPNNPAAITQHIFEER